MRGLGSHYPKSTSDHPKGQAQHVCCIFVTITYISTQRRSQGHTRVKAFSRCSCQVVFPSAPPLFSWSWKSWSPFTSPPRVLAVNSPLRVPRAPHPRAQMYNFRFETIDFTRPPVRQRLCTIPPRPPHPPQVRPSSPKDFPKAIIGGRPRLRDQLLLLSYPKLRRRRHGLSSAPTTNSQRTAPKTPTSEPRYLHGEYGLNQIACTG